MPKVQAAPKWREVDVHAATTGSGGLSSKKQVVETIVHQDVKYLKVSAYANWLQMICTGKANRVCNVPLFGRLQKEQAKLLCDGNSCAGGDPVPEDPMADAMASVTPKKSRKRRAPCPADITHTVAAVRADLDGHEVNMLYVPSKRQAEKTMWVAEHDIPWLVGKVHEELSGTQPETEQHIGDVTYSPGMWSLRWRDAKTGEVQEVKTEVPQHKTVAKNKIPLSPAAFLRKKRAARCNLLAMANLRGYEHVETSPQSSGLAVDTAARAGEV